MPNRIYDSVIAVDSAMGNFSIVGGSSSNITQYSIIGVSFTATTTAGSCIISAANTLDIIVEFPVFISATNNGVVDLFRSFTFSKSLRMGDIKCPTLVAGSARVYLG